MAAGFVVPACFYSFCIATCFVRLPRRILVASTIVIALISAPVFWNLQFHYPTIARNAVLTAFWWAFVFAELYTEPSGGRDKAPEAEIDEEPGIQ